MRVTKSCNLRCKYCFVPVRDNLVMNKRTLENSIQKFCQVNKKIRFIWYGGEPLIVGKDVYQDIINIQATYKDVEITNVVQTNCTLLADDSFVEFLHKNGFNIGISCDGPADIQDIMRPLVNGMPSLKLVERGIANLSMYTKGNLSGNCVISKLSLGKTKEVYSFFKEREFSTLLISPYEGRDTSLILKTNEYFELMKDFYSLWTSDDKPIQNVSPFINIVKKLFAAPDNICYFDGSCFNYFLAIDPNGDISPCCTIDKPILGNINHDSIESILSSSELSELKKIEGGVKRNCKVACNYFYVCNGGCRGSSYLTTGDISARDIYCEGRYLLIDYIKKDLEKKINLNGRNEVHSLEDKLCVTNNQ